MPAAEQPSVLYVIGCGSPPAAELPDFVTYAKEQGWEVCVIATPEGTKFLDADRLAELTGHPVRSQYKRPEEPDALPPPDAFVVAPATFNTINKLAQGISDTLALGLLNEGIGRRAPAVAAPWLNAPLRSHPIVQRSLATLSEWGVRVILNPQPAAGAAVFPWDKVRASLRELRETCIESAGDPH